MSPSRRVGPAPNCPDVELAASSWPRRIGGAESAAPSCPRPVREAHSVVLTIIMITVIRFNAEW